MQISPSEMRACSLWQWAAMVQGWNEANKPAQDESLKPEEELSLANYIEQPPIWMQ